MFDYKFVFEGMRRKPEDEYSEIVDAIDVYIGLSVSEYEYIKKLIQDFFDKRKANV